MELASCLQQLGYDESFFFHDLKLGLGLFSVGIAGGLFYLDKKFSFEDTYTITAIAVVVYFLISCVLFGINHLSKFKNVKYIGFKNGNKQQKISIATWTHKYDGLYYVKIMDENETIETNFPFNKFFDGMGYFSPQAFIDLLKPQLEKLKKNQ